ncbi:MAG: SusC/RagA family TonB-linked outer membrane protein [Flavobacteriales bacterium]|nr:SusC/RagA family TonB-linked outer membrane protein [Flavobacteriales bacterium]
MLRSYLIALSIFLCFATATVGQTIYGVVTDENGDPFPGVVVSVTASNKGTATDFDGKYSIPLTPGKHLVEFGFTGYVKQTKEIQLNEGAELKLDIQMKSDVITLDNVEIIGYGVQRNRPNTGSVSRIGGKEIAAIRTPSFEAALQGQAPGLQVSQASGIAGAGSLIRIRGIASISAGGDPLYIVDGIPITQDYFLRGNSGALNNNPLASINPSDIENVEIRKDAAAAGEYGSRAANGVIIITTKRAKEKGWKFDFSTNFGVSTPATLPNMLNSAEYLQLRQEAWQNDGGTGFVWLPNLTSADDDAATRETAYLKAQKTDTDWVDQTLGTGSKYGVNFGARYGAAKSNVYFSVGYDNNESFLVGNGYERISARVNPEFKVTDKLKANLSLSLTRGINNRVDAAWSGGLGDAMSNALPYYPVYHTDTVFGDNGDVLNVPGDYFFWRDEFGFTKNPVAYQNEIDWKTIEDRAINTGRIIYMPMKDLFVIATGGFDWMSIRENKLTPATFDLSNGFGSAYSDQRLVRNYSYNVTAEKLFKLREELVLSVLVGHELQKSRTEFISESWNGLFDNVVELSDVGSADSLKIRSVSNPEQYAFFGFFAKANLSYKSKYYFEAAFRRDGSSRFGKNEKFGDFPSLSAGWIVSEEKFLKGKSTLTYLKLRASWGLTGNSNIPPLSQYSTFSRVDNGIYYNQNPILFPTQAGNPNLKWETSSNISVAAEAGFWNDKLTFTLEWYRKYSTDVLMNVSLPASVGFSNFYDNVAEVLNSGVELGTTVYWINKRNFTWKMITNLAYNYNELVDIGAYTPDAVSGGTNDSRVIVGEPIGSFYLVEFSHVDSETGLPVYLDLNGNETFDYDNSIRKYVGDGLPDFVGGLTNQLTYKNFTLTSLFTFSVGAKIFDSSGKRQMGVVSGWNMRDEIFDRWRQPGDNSVFPLLTLDETTYSLPSGFPWWNTSLFMYDASYLRLRNLSIDYMLPVETSKKMKMDNIVVGVSVTNLFTITNFPGLDPEVVRDFENPQDRNLSPNVTYLTPMQERSYNIRLSANF